MAPGWGPTVQKPLAAGRFHHKNTLGMFQVSFVVELCLRVLKASAL